MRGRDVVNVPLLLTSGEEPLAPRVKFETEKHSGVSNFIGSNSYVINSEHPDISTDFVHKSRFRWLYIAWQRGQGTGHSDARQNCAISLWSATIGLLYFISVLTPCWGRWRRREGWWFKTLEIPGKGTFSVKFQGGKIVFCLEIPRGNKLFHSFHEQFFFSQFQFNYTWNF